MLVVREMLARTRGAVLLLVLFHSIRGFLCLLDVSLVLMYSPLGSMASVRWVPIRIVLGLMEGGYDNQSSGGSW